MGHGCCDYSCHSAQIPKCPSESVGCRHSPCWPCGAEASLDLLGVQSLPTPHFRVFRVWPPTPISTVFRAWHPPHNPDDLHDVQSLAPSWVQQVHVWLAHWHEEATVAKWWSWLPVLRQPVYSGRSLLSTRVSRVPVQESLRFQPQEAQSCELFTGRAGEGPIWLPSLGSLELCMQGSKDKGSFPDRGLSTDPTSWSAVPGPHRPRLSQSCHPRWAIRKSPFTCRPAASG